MDAATFSDALKRSPAFARCLRRYLYVLVNLLAGTAACGHFHPVEVRLARWLPMMRDPAQSSGARISTKSSLMYSCDARAPRARSGGARPIRYRRIDAEIRDLARLEAVA